MQTLIPDSYERVAMPEPARSLLCKFAAGDPGLPLPHVDVDWASVFAGVCRHGLLGLTHRYLKQQPTSEYPPPEFHVWVRDAYRLQALRMALIYRYVRHVLSHLQEAGLDFMVIKGPAVAYTVYPQPVIRTFNDLDLMVLERDWRQIHTALLSIGFTAEKDWSGPEPKLIAQTTIYEVKYWHAQMGLRVEVHYDDLLNAGLTSRDLDGYWRRAFQIDIGGLTIKTLALDDQLIHLCAHAHYHGYTRLSWFADIALIVRDHGARLNWDRLIETVRKEEAHVPVYYTLIFLDRLLGVGAPERVLAAVRPDRFRRRMHEHYLPEGQVLSLQPMYRPDFSFYFLPLRKRLLPDLHVMGRRKEKVRYLLRLLVPPRAWLRCYYRLHSNQAIALHYLLHPLKLLIHYAGEFMTTPGASLDLAAPRQLWMSGNTEREIS